MLSRRTLLTSGLLTLLVLLGLFFYRQSYLNRCANTRTCTDNPKVSVDNGEQATFLGQNLQPPNINLSAKPDTQVLGEATSNGEKHIYVDLSTQTLSAYEGDNLFMQVPISSGKWYPTPTGDFTIWIKMRATKMSGGEGADYYYLPNVPYVMFFSNNQVAPGRGFSLHGTYWHNNFGHPMSHGCVNMRTIDAEKLYYWVHPETNGTTTRATASDPGTKITIYGKAPN